MTDKQRKLEQIEELFNSTEKLFLLGAGCGVCADLPLMDDLTKEVLAGVNNETKEVLGSLEKEVDGNIEDILSQLNNHIAVASKRKDTSVGIDIGGSPFQKGDLEKTLRVYPLLAHCRRPFQKNDLEKALQEAKKAIAQQIKGKSTTIDYHLNFVQAVHRPRRPGREAGIPTVHYFVLNYDTLIEDALGFEGISYTDGMLGGTIAQWKPELFNQEHLQAKVFKLHGSLDWYAKSETGVVRRLPENPEHLTNDGQQLIIAPAESKYAETQDEPYATLMTRFKDILGKSLKDTTLFIIGYGFGDAHINRHIEQALQFNKNLTVIALICKDYRKHIPSNWSEHGLIILDEDDSWKFENFTRLIGENT